MGKCGGGGESTSFTTDMTGTLLIFVLQTAVFFHLRTVQCPYDTQYTEDALRCS
jgi:hypothetical protein